MNYYETLYIVHPALESGRLKDIITDVEQNLNKLGGKLLAVELWGRRKLSYLIDKQKYGTYVLMQFNGEGKCTNNLAVDLEQNPNILAYITTSISSEDLIEMTEDLDSQIAGKSRDSEKSNSNNSTDNIKDSTKSTDTESNVEEKDKNDVSNVSEDNTKVSNDTDESSDNQSNQDSMEEAIEKTEE